MPPSKEKHEVGDGAAPCSIKISIGRVCNGKGYRPSRSQDFRDADMMISRFGVIPKGLTGKWWMIVDLLFPEGSSMNDGVEADICSLHYAKVEEATEELVKQGRNC